MINFLSNTEMRIPDRILIDINPVLYKISTEHYYPEFYSKFPIHEIVATLLTSPMLDDEGELIWYQVEKRFDAELDTMDMDNTQILFFTITEEVDKYIRQQIVQSYPQEAYVFDRWIDNSTIMLKSINTNTANGSFLVI